MNNAERLAFLIASHIFLNVKTALPKQNMFTFSQTDKIK